LIAQRPATEWNGSTGVLCIGFAFGTTNYVGSFATLRDGEAYRELSAASNRPRPERKLNRESFEMPR